MRKSAELGPQFLVALLRARQKIHFSLRRCIFRILLISGSTSTDRDPCAPAEHGALSAVGLDDAFERVESTIDGLDAVYRAALEEVVSVFFGTLSGFFEFELVALLGGFVAEDVVVGVEEGVLFDAVGYEVDVDNFWGVGQGVDEFLGTENGRGSEVRASGGVSDHKNTKIAKMALQTGQSCANENNKKLPTLSESSNFG